MNTDQAIKVLEQALNVSAKAGVFGLQDAVTVNTAFEIIKKYYTDSLPVVDKELVLDKKSKK